MVQIRYDNPFEELEKLVEQRKKLAAQTDQLYMMNPPNLQGDTPLRITIEGTNCLFKGRHHVIIRKVLKILYAEYQTRLERKEKQIQALTPKLTNNE